MPEKRFNQDKKLKGLLLALFLAGASVTGQAASGITEAMDTIAKGDYHTGVKLLGPLARQGNPEAQFLLGRAYSHGEGVEPDPSKAVKWLARAAEQMHYKAANTLGKLYSSGKGVKINADLAAKWYARAAEIAEATGIEHVDCTK
jgi:TPR repeat protein